MSEAVAGGRLLLRRLLAVDEADGVHLVPLRLQDHEGGGAARLTREVELFRSTASVEPQA